MTIRAEREVQAPAAKTLAGLATAGENLGYKVRDVRVKSGLLLMSSRMRLRDASLGTIITARVQRRPRGSHVSLDSTPVLGSWAIASGRQGLDRLLQEFQSVMGAPRARIRTPEKVSPGARPFGYRPEIHGSIWATLSLLFYGLLLGGLWWIPAGLGLLGGALLFSPRTDAWWHHMITLFAIFSLPFGVFGAIGRRLAKTNLYWQGTMEAIQG